MNHNRVAVFIYILVWMGIVHNYFFYGIRETISYLNLFFLLNLQKYMCYRTNTLIWNYCFYGYFPQKKLMFIIVKILHNAIARSGLYFEIYISLYQWEDRS